MTRLGIRRLHFLRFLLRLQIGMLVHVQLDQGTPNPQIDPQTSHWNHRVLRCAYRDMALVSSSNAVLSHLPLRLWHCLVWFRIFEWHCAQTMASLWYDRHSAPTNDLKASYKWDVLILWAPVFNLWGPSIQYAWIGHSLNCRFILTTLIDFATINWKSSKKPVLVHLRSLSNLIVAEPKKSLFKVDAHCVWLLGIPIPKWKWKQQFVRYMATYIRKINYQMTVVELQWPLILC